MSDILERVTDPKILERLSGKQKITKGLQDSNNSEELPESTGAFSTFGRSALGVGPAAIARLLQATGAVSPENLEKILPVNAAYERGKTEHPIAHGLGTVAGVAGLLLTRGRSGLGAAAKTAKNLAPLISEKLKGIKNTASDVAEIPNIRSQRNQAQMANEGQEATLKDLISQYTEREGGLNTPEAISRKINQRQEQFNELEPAANIPHEETENLLNWPEGDELPVNANKQITQITQELQTHLGHGTKIDTLLADKLKQTVRQKKKYIRDKYYKPVEEYAERNFVKFPNTPDLAGIEQKLKFLSKDPALQSKLRGKLIAEESKGNTLVLAKDLIRQWRATKDALNKANRLAHKPGFDNQAFYKQQAEELTELADEQLKILTHHLPEQAKNLTEGNQMWGREIMSMYGNPVYEQALSKGRIDVENIMHESRGTGRGQQQIKKMILQNPELNKLAVGHTYAEKPAGLLSASPHELDFIHKLPKLVEKIHKLKEYTRNADIAKAQHKLMQENRARATASHEEAVRQQKSRQSAIQKREKLEYEISHYKKLRTNLKHELEMKKITQAEFEELDAQYKNAIAGITKTLKYGAYGTLIAGGVKGISSMISNLL